MSQLLGDPETFEGAESGDARTPVDVLAGARRLPIPGHELANAARDHGAQLLSVLSEGHSARLLRSARNDSGSLRGARRATKPTVRVTAVVASEAKQTPTVTVRPVVASGAKQPLPVPRTDVDCARDHEDILAQGPDDILADLIRSAHGRNPKTGFARRPLDNVGVQYGLVAFNAGAITAEQFLREEF